MSEVPLHTLILLRDPNVPPQPYTLNLEPYTLHLEKTNTYRGTSPIKKRQPRYAPPMTLDVGLQ